MTWEIKRSRSSSMWSNWVGLYSSEIVYCDPAIVLNLTILPRDTCRRWPQAEVDLQKTETIRMSQNATIRFLRHTRFHLSHFKSTNTDNSCPHQIPPHPLGALSRDPLVLVLLCLGGDEVQEAAGTDGTVALTPPPAQQATLVNLIPKEPLRHPQRLSRSRQSVSGMRNRMNLIENYCRPKLTAHRLPSILGSRPVFVVLHSSRNDKS